jgi:sterol desaturase/sphingolipid hydroxylase (fatty acid hydroxylase superfamily)
MKHYVSNSEDSSRMFKSDLIELLSKVHFSVPLIIFVPTISFFLYLGINAQLSVSYFLLYFLLGFLIWTVTEYVMHRFIFHYEPSSKVGQRLHFIFHGVHHDYPKDRYRLVLPPIVSIPLASMFYFIYRNVISTDGFYPFFAAFLIGYLVYDMLHYAIHHVQFKGKIWNVLKSHHLKHHYVHPEKGYGVSSPLWDKIARTEFPVDKKNTSESA